jgi:hypothetical protein
MGIKIFKKLPFHFKELVKSLKIFMRTLKKYLVFHCFYKFEGFFGVNS